MSAKTRSARRLSPAKVRGQAGALVTSQEPPREICIISKAEMVNIIDEAVSRTSPLRPAEKAIVASPVNGVVAADAPIDATLPQLHRELDFIHMRCNELCGRFSVSVERLTGHTHIPGSPPSETSAKKGQLAQLHRVTQDVHRLLHTLDGIARHLDELTAES